MPRLAFRAPPVTGRRFVPLGAQPPRPRTVDVFGHLRRTYVFTPFAQQRTSEKIIYSRLQSMRLRIKAFATPDTESAQRARRKAIANFKFQIHRLKYQISNM
jgi:hypothetical protein